MSLKKRGNAIRYFEVIFFKATLVNEAKLKKKENTWPLFSDSPYPAA
jgi:hypothetical protein